MHSAFDPVFEDHRAETAYVHESAYLDSPCHVGEHSTILHFTHIMANVIIGDHCVIGRNVTIASGVLLGNDVRVMNNAQLNSGVILEDSVICGAGVVFTESRYVRANPKNISRISPTLVKRGTQIGPNTTIASGSTVGRFAFIEAGTIVDRNIPDFAIVYGNPLKFAGWHCECGQCLPLSPQQSSKPLSGKARPDRADNMTCSYCNRRYQWQSQWKILQLSPGDATIDSHSEFDPTVRTAENRDR